MVRQAAMLGAMRNHPFLRSSRPSRSCSAAKAAIIALLLAGASAMAGPAPWYKWRSRVDGAMVCSQTPLGPGWEKTLGPYRDSQCKHLRRQ